jgi:arsenical pump membrane protein
LIGAAVTRAVSCALCGATLIAVATRAAGLSESLWAAMGAVILVGIGGVSFSQALGAVSRGADVYLFLVGMMVLAGLLGRHGVFDWLAMHALRMARGSPLRLLALVYLVGVVVTHERSAASVSLCVCVRRKRCQLSLAHIQPG